MAPKVGKKKVGTRKKQSAQERELPRVSRPEGHTSPKRAEVSSRATSPTVLSASQRTVQTSSSSGTPSSIFSFSPFSRVSKPGYTKSGVAGPLHTLRLSERASYLPHKSTGLTASRPIPIMTMWAIALFFVCIIVIPDLNQRLMSIPVRPAIQIHLAASAARGSDKVQGGGRLENRGREGRKGTGAGRPVRSEGEASSGLYAKADASGADSARSGRAAETGASKGSSARSGNAAEADASGQSSARSGMAAEADTSGTSRGQTRQGSGEGGQRMEAESGGSRLSKRGSRKLKSSGDEDDRDKEFQDGKAGDHHERQEETGHPGKQDDMGVEGGKKVQRVPKVQEDNRHPGKQAELEVDEGQEAQKMQEVPKLQKVKKAESAHIEAEDGEQERQEGSRHEDKGRRRGKQQVETEAQSDQDPAADAESDGAVETEAASETRARRRRRKAAVKMETEAEAEAETETETVSAVAAKLGETRILGEEEEVFWLDPVTDGRARPGNSKSLSANGRGRQRAAGEEEEEEEGGEEGDLSYWPSKLILAMATGYEMKNLSVLISTFQRHVDGAKLVLFVEEPIKGYKPHKGVVIQKFHRPEKGFWSRLPLWLVRFRAFQLFLETTAEQVKDRKHASVIFTDSRDVAFLGDPFTVLKNHFSAYLFQDSPVYPEPKSKKATDSQDRYAACYGSRGAFSLAGKNVVNAGFMAGGLEAMLQVAASVVKEAEKLPVGTCLQEWGSDEAIINHLVRSGSLRQSVPLLLETNEHGPVLHRFSRKAVVQIASPEELEDSRPLFRNKDGRRVLVIHGYDQFDDTYDAIKDGLYMMR